MIVKTEIAYILNPVKEAQACMVLGDAMAKERDGWEWEVKTTTTAYTFTKRKLNRVEIECHSKKTRKGEKHDKSRNAV